MKPVPTSEGGNPLPQQDWEIGRELLGLGRVLGAEGRHTDAELIKKAASRLGSRIGVVSCGRVREAYEEAVLAVARINSPDASDSNLLPYYEGRRDALKRLLEPEEPRA